MAGDAAKSLKGAKVKHTAADVRRAVGRVRAVLDREGLLVCHDPEIPSATALIAGEPIRGTWWPHPKGSLIYDALGALEEDIAWPKLVKGKMTLVHRKLWPSLFVAGTSRAPWQMHKLKTRKGGTTRGSSRRGLPGQTRSGWEKWTFRRSIRQSSS